MHGRHLEHLALAIANSHGLRAIFNNPGSKSAALSNGHHFAGDSNRISSRKREAFLLEKFRAANMDINNTGRSLYAYMRADGWNA
jgi:hypothetical protein